MKHSIDVLHDCGLFFFVADREVQRILLELLNQMDGFDQNVNVKVSMSMNSASDDACIIIMWC